MRDDLELLDGPSTASGEPTWTVFDPVRQTYFRVGHTAFELLSRWHAGDSERLLQRLEQESTVVAGIDELLMLIRFLREHNLLRGDGAADVEFLRQQQRARRQTLWQWLLHHYLFFRIPLVRPDRFLAATLRWVQPLYSRTCLYLVLGAGLLGIVLAAQQWDQFAHTFRRYFSAEGIVYFAVALGSVKLLHELGHAYTMKRYGGRVPTMGFGLLVLMPVLYTDATDSWRLRSRRQRAAVAAAGMIVELSVALLATLAWSFLPDGPARSAAFFLATASWVTTLVINLSPFTRFDGYFVLSDWLGVDNLQARSFALARWRLRELLFALGEPSPESFAPRTRRLLLLYAYAAWTYRLILFTGIALIVYHLFFKLLGLLLLGVEMGWFVVSPIVREGREWWTRRSLLRANRHSLLTLSAALGLLLLLLLPWQRHVSAPAVEKAARYALLYPASPARIAAVLAAPGADVRAGQVLYRLASPKLEHRLSDTDGAIASLELQLRQRIGSADDLRDFRVLQQRLATEVAARDGLARQEGQLVVRAPFAGKLLDVPDSLAAGCWVSTQQFLGRLVAPRGVQFVAYLPAAELYRVSIGARARFYPDDPALAPVDAIVTAIGSANLKTLGEPYVSSIYRGAIAVTRDRRGRLIPVDSIYRVELIPRKPLAVPARVVRGEARISAAPRSPLAELWRLAAGDVIRQSGF